MTGFEWVGELARASVAWVPRIKHVQANEAGVKFVRARTRVIEPGLHLWWPLTTKIELAVTARCILDLDVQVLVTSCGRSVLAGGVVAYKVVDVHKFLVDNYDADENLGEVCEVAMRRAVIAKSFDDLQKTRAEIDNLLTKEVQKMMTPFGVEVEYVRLGDLAPARVFYLAGAREKRLVSKHSEDQPS